MELQLALPLLTLLSLLLPTVRSAAIPPQESILLQTKCPNYARYATQRHSENRSIGRHKLPFQRPSEDCRTYRAQEVEDAIDRMGKEIQDPDLFRLFENAFPNTLDTAVKWKGFAWEDGTEGKETDEDLAFVITGDM